MGAWFRILNLSRPLSPEKSTIGARLKEERERLGYNQTKFAALAQASKHSQIDWESDKSAPNARYLAEIQKAGADVLYIITNERRSAPAGAFRPAVLRQVIEGIEITLVARRSKLPPAKKAELVCLLYEHFQAAESVESATVERFLRLVA